MVSTIIIRIKLKLSKNGSTKKISADLIKYADNEYSVH